jgi:large exoprotein involved in heme utilization and adhesion
VEKFSQSENPSAKPRRQLTPARQDPSKWHTFTGPADVAVPTPDGQGGIWLGPDYHWTGGTWVDTSAVAWPTDMTGAGFGGPVRIPGAPSSYWGTGTLDVTPSGVSGAAAFLYGPTPRG